MKAEKPEGSHRLSPFRIMENKWIVHNIHLIPGSKLNQIVGYMDNGSLKVKIKAKPIEGKANKELLKYLSEVLEIKLSEIEIESGFTSRNKIVRIWKVDKARIKQKILE